MATSMLSSKQIKELTINVSFFRGISKDLLIETITHVSLRKYPCSQSILFDNHSNGSIHFITDGWIKVRTTDGHSENNIYGIYGPGEIIGVIAAMEENWHQTEALTLTSAKVWSIPAQDFISLLNHCPQAGIQVAIFISKRLRKLNQYFRIREAESTVKVAYLLLQLVEDIIKFKRQKVIIPNLPHKEVAVISGITRETVSRALTRLEKRGLIMRQGATIQVLQFESLRHMVDGNLD